MQCVAGAVGTIMAGLWQVETLGHGGWGGVDSDCQQCSLLPVLLPPVKRRRLASRT